MSTLIFSLRQTRWMNIFVIYVRYLVGGTFVFASVPKILGERFLTSNSEDAPINTFPHLFETLYRSGLYWEFLGWGQLVAAFLLMTQLFSTLGALAFLPILLNIFVITLSYQFGGTPVIVGLMLLANILLLVWDYNKLKVLILPDSSRDFKFDNYHNRYFNHPFWAVLGLIIFITTVIFVLNYGRDPIMWFFVCVTEGLVGFIFMRRWEIRQSN